MTTQVSARVIQITNCLPSGEKIGDFLKSEFQEKYIGLFLKEDDNMDLNIANGNFYYNRMNGKEEEEEVLVLRDINLSVTKGEFLIIVGKNGSGKTSLLKAILGELSQRNDPQASLYVNKSLSYAR